MITIQEMSDFLCAQGFIVGARDPRINTDYEGAFMVVEYHDENELPTKDGSNGPWAVVGNDLDYLIREAYNVWRPEYE